MFKIGNVEIPNRIVMAPMAGITNKAFRTIIKEFGAGLVYSEMVSDKAIFYKKTHFETTVNINGRPEYYNDSRLHKNAVTAETLTIIDHTILFSLANYFLRFSTEYKKQHHVENFDNDWYEFVEYGSTNPLTILLQRNGFSRETSTYIKQNQGKYVEVTASGPKLKISLLECPKESVRSEVQDIQYNIPEIFIK